MPAAYLAVVLILDLVVCGPLSAWIATQKGRSPSAWFVVGAVAGPFALLAVGLAPGAWEAAYGRSLARACPTCGTLVSVVASRCPACGAAVPAAPSGPDAQPEAPQRGSEGLAGLRTARSASSSLDPAPPAGRTASRAVGATATTPVSAVEAEAVSPVASAVFAGGTGRLSIGDRYLLAYAADGLRVMGPLNATPSQVALTLVAGSLGAAGIGDSLAVSGQLLNGQPATLEFRGLAGAEVEQIMALIEASAGPADASEADAFDTGAAIPVDEAPPAAAEPGDGATVAATGTVPGQRRR
ncbi:MAG TPA: hypothetical protein VF763_12175 [Candidatus Limnocylindrales bacterium]